ncbi:MAG: GAF domain-containing protein [Demequina sp.]|nr:GAF domain-containing protein [Demequina sp.]
MGRDDALTGSPLLDAILSLNSQLDLPSILDRFISAATEQTGARYGAINIVDSNGTSIEFHFTGVRDGVWERIGRAPNHVATLARIPDEGVIVIDELTKHPSFAGFPPGHPPMGAFLGTALKVRGEVYGYLYLADKESGFTDADQAAVLALAAAGSVAIDNAQLYERAVSRERWLEASQQITTGLLSNPGDEEALAVVVESAKRLAGAGHAALVLPGLRDSWVMEFTSGPRAAEMLGLALPEDGYALSTIRSGEGTIAAAPPGGTILMPVQELGPTLYAPLRAGDRSVGLLMLWRDQGQRPFDADDLATAQRFANQAAIALTLSELAHAKNVSQLLEERERLADDLHDFVSQELFATAMQIEAISADVSPEAAERLSRTLDHVKRAQHEVRGVMSTLAGHRSSEPFGERVNRELIMAHDSLGFAPTLHTDWSGVDDAVAGDVSLGDDVVAVLRELLSNVARHADAKAVHIDLSVADGRLSLVVTDNGIGPAGARNRHSGTSNLAGRALRRNGTFTLDPVAPAADHPGTRAEWNVEVEG